MLRVEHDTDETSNKSVVMHSKRDNGNEIGSGI